MDAPEDDRSRHRQATFRILVNPHGSTFRFLHLFKDAFAGFDIQPSPFRQAEMTARSLQHARFQMRLEFRNSSTHGGQRHIQLLGGCRKTASLYDLQQNCHCTEFVHDLSSQIRQPSFSEAGDFPGNCNHI